MTDRPRPSRLVLLGHPVAHSLSPRFQQAALDAAGLPLLYTAADTRPEELTAALQRLARDGAAGNVTLPHKAAVFAACAQRTSIAERTGAVNTFWHDAQGRLVGDNTDVAGVRAAIGSVAPQVLRPDRFGQGQPLAPRVALLGAGGVAASVLLALADVPDITVTIAARSPDKANSLLTRLAMPGLQSTTVLRTAEEAVAGAHLVINATPIGLTDDAMPVDPAALAAGTAVLDLVYRRGFTRWVLACRDRGLLADDGLRMLVEQGAASFAAWFGVSPDRSAMWNVLEPRPLVVARGTRPQVT